MSLSREQMLVEMGISPIWVEREPDSHLRTAAVEIAQTEIETIGKEQISSSANTSSAVHKTQTTEPSAAFPSIPTVDALNWPELGQQVANCQACPLCQQRKQAVLGVGDTQAEWLFIGEGPGAEEDTQGEPFVGQAGKLLDNMLLALDINRNQKVYIANAVKCRPPGNRTPEQAEIATCRPYLERQVALINPKIIVLLGKVAVSSVLKEDKTLTSMRGQRFEYAGIPVVVTYHPAYLLRNLPDKAKAWEDLLFARKLMSEQIAPQLPF